MDERRRAKSDAKPEFKTSIAVWPSEDKVNFATMAPINFHLFGKNKDYFDERTRSKSPSTNMERRGKSPAGGRRRASPYRSPSRHRSSSRGPRDSRASEGAIAKKQGGGDRERHPARSRYQDDRHQYASYWREREMEAEKKREREERRELTDRTPLPMPRSAAAARGRSDFSRAARDEKPYWNRSCGYKSPEETRSFFAAAADGDVRGRNGSCLPSGLLVSGDEVQVIQI